MAGSYRHCVDEQGMLREPVNLIRDMLTTGADVYEAIEESRHLAGLVAADPLPPAPPVAERPARPGWDSPSRPREPGRDLIPRTLWEAAG